MHAPRLHDRVVVLPHPPGLGDLAGRAGASINFPHDVLAREDLAPQEKRAILSAWASDAYAVESFPTLRHLPGTPFPVTFSAIRDALDRLDRETLGGDFAVIAAARAKQHSPRA